MNSVGAESSVSLKLVSCIAYRVVYPQNAPVLLAHPQRCSCYRARKRGRSACRRWLERRGQKLDAYGAQPPKKSPHERRRHLNPEFYTPNPQPQTLNHRRSVVGRSSRRCAIAIRPALVRPPVALYAELISTLSSACTALTCGAPAVGVRILTKMDLQATRAFPSAEPKSMIEGSASMASG